LGVILLFLTTVPLPTTVIEGLGAVALRSVLVKIDREARVSEKANLCQLGIIGTLGVTIPWRAVKYMVHS
jgi:hypothetical protein